MRPRDLQSLSTHTLTQTGDGAFTLVLGGALETTTIAPVWRQLLQLIEKSPPKSLLIDAAKLTFCDTAAIAFLADIRAQLPKSEIQIQNLPEQYQHLSQHIHPASIRPLPKPKPRPSFLERRPLLSKIKSLFNSTITLVSFTGQLSHTLFNALLHPKKIRWADTILVCQRAGAEALPIIFLLSFLMGLIIAFQSAVPMKQFGAEIYVADLVALAMLRELGPLVAVIILAGRSGSAFAAEIGTMKVNEEINALETMAINPYQFLLVPRVIASVAMAPLLTLFANLAGLIGASIVLMTMGYSLHAYINEVLSIISLKHLFIGLSKTLFFGLLVSAIGCLRGFQTANGASSVGTSTTSAVVSGITLIVISDGIFSVLCYYLNI